MVSLAADFTFHIQRNDPCKKVIDFYARCFFRFVDSNSFVQTLSKISHENAEETLVVGISDDMLDSKHHNNLSSFDE